MYYFTQRLGELLNLLANLSVKIAPKPNFLMHFFMSTILNNFQKCSYFFRGNILYSKNK